MGKRRRAGFTLIEAMVAVVLLAVGIVSVLGALGAISHSEAYAREKEKMQRLAAMKYEELIATGEAQNPMESGDFQEVGLDGYSWDLSSEPSGVENLNAVTVTVTKDQRPLKDLTEKTEGLLYVPPQTGTAGGAAQ